MGKAIGALPSWYWPDGVQRYLKAPRVALYELTVGRWSRRYGSDPALVTAAGSRTFAELDTAAASVAARYLARYPDADGRVAVAVHSPDAFAPLFLGLARAEALQLVFEAGSKRAGEALAEFRPGLLITDGAPPPGVTAEVVSAAEFLEATRGPTQPARGPDPARQCIAMPGHRSPLVWHSQMTLMSGAMAFAAFVNVQPASKLLVAKTMGSWETLTGLLAPLQAGAPAILDPGDDAVALARLVREHTPRALWISADSAQHLLDAATLLVAAIRETRPDLLVTATRPFPKRVRRSLRRVLQTHVLTVLGYPETGPIAACHPSWYLDEAAGIPMTGVDFVPVNPETGKVVQTPWELLSYAAVGACTHALAPSVEAMDESGSDTIDSRCYNTGALGVMDSNGILFLLD